MKNSQEFVRRESGALSKLFAASIILSLVVGSVIAESAQIRVLSLNDVISLLKAGVTSARIVQLVQQNGVGFELDDQTSRRLTEEGADGSVINALRVASGRYVRERQRQMELVAAETKRKLEQERREAEEKQRLEEARRQKEEARRHAEIERQNRIEAEARERQGKEEKRKAEERAARQAEAENQKKQEIARARAVELAKREKAAQLEKAKLDPRTAIAPSPGCSVGLRHVFQYEGGGRFTRQIDRLDGGLCVIGLQTYDSNWTLVKQIGRGGEEITASRPDYPLVGEKWLPFPLTVGKEWQVKYHARFTTGPGVGLFVNFFEIISVEKINTQSGTFAAFKIRQEQRHGSGRRGVRYFWYAPEVEYYVKHEVARQEGSSPDYWATVKNYELVSVVRGKK